MLHWLTNSFKSDEKLSESLHYQTTPGSALPFTAYYKTAGQTGFNSLWEFPRVCHCSVLFCSVLLTLIFLSFNNTVHGESGS